LEEINGYFLETSSPRIESTSAGITPFTRQPGAIAITSQPKPAWSTEEEVSLLARSLSPPRRQTAGANVGLLLEPTVSMRIVRARA